MRFTNYSQRVDISHYGNLSFVKGFALQNYKTAEEGIVDAYHHGYQYWYIDGSFSTEHPSRWSNERINNLLKLMSQYNISPILHGNFKIPLASDIDELRLVAIEYAKKEVELAEKLGASLIVHGGAIVEPRLVKQVKKIAINNYIDTISILQDFSSKKNVQLFLENLSNYKNYRPFHYIFTHDEEFEQILSRIDLPMFLDVGHANVCDGDPINLIEKYSHRIAGMSFSNNDGVRDLHLPLNNGTINYKKIISTITQLNWQGIIAFETRGNYLQKNIQDLMQIYYSIQ